MFSFYLSKVNHCSSRSGFVTASGAQSQFEFTNLAAAIFIHSRDFFGKDPKPFMM